MKPSARLRTLYTVGVFLTLAAFEHIIIGLFPPLFGYVARDLQTNPGRLGYVSAGNILATALSSIYWGYLSGKHNRKNLIMIGTLIWVLSIFLTSLSRSFGQLLLFQMITGLGLGCMASIGFSVLTDYIPHHKRGLILSFWGMAQGFGGIAGSVLASLISASHGWRQPFVLVGFVGLILLIFFLLVEEPERGSAEPEWDAGRDYRYLLEFRHLKGLLLKGSNRYLFLQAFFLNVATGSLIWVPTLYSYKIIQQGYDLRTAVIASGYLYALFQIGGMTSAFFGHLGDVVQRKSAKGRARLTAWFVLLTVPMYLLFFALPLRNLSMPRHPDVLRILIGLIDQIFTNPWMFWVFALSLAASAAQSANTPNWLALITDVNLPEHRGIAFSVANLFNSVGRTAGNIGVGILLGATSRYYHQPLSYIATLSLLQLFLIPSAFCYLRMAHSNVADIRQVKRTLRERIE